MLQELPWAIPAPNPDVSKPPASLDTDPFYQKYLNAIGGIPVLSSRQVSDGALTEAVYLMGQMLQNRRDVARAMAGRDVRYDPGIWYNSAKFLELEYQTYGFVPNLPRDDQINLWWEHAGGMKGLRLVLDASGVLVAMNIMGMRYRHEVCERWIAERREVEFVLDHLGDANFDTEFFVKHELQIAQAKGGGG